MRIIPLTSVRRFPLLCRRFRRRLHQKRVSFGVRSTARTVLSASMMRESSPPEAIFSRGQGSSPGFAEIKKIRFVDAAGAPRNYVGPRDRESGVRHRQGLQFPFHGAFEFLRSASPFVAQLSGRPRQYSCRSADNFVLKLFFFAFRQTYAVHFASYFLEVF